MYEKRFTSQLAMSSMSNIVHINAQREIALQCLILYTAIQR